MYLLKNGYIYFETYKSENKTKIIKRKAHKTNKIKGCTYYINIDNRKFYIFDNFIIFK